MDRAVLATSSSTVCATLPREGETPIRCPFTMSTRLREQTALAVDTCIRLGGDDQCPALCLATLTTALMQRGPGVCQGVARTAPRIHQRRTLPDNAIQTKTDRAMCRQWRGTRRYPAGRTAQA